MILDIIIFPSPRLPFQGRSSNLYYLRIFITVFPLFTT